jgi:hypothetical protein
MRRSTSYGYESRLPSVALGLLAAGLLACAVNAVHKTHRRRIDERSTRKPEPLQTWEGEGGLPSDDAGQDALVRVG